MARITAALSLVFILALAWMLARPAPRLPAPMELSPEIAAPVEVSDPRGGVTFRHVRAVEEGTFYTGDMFPPASDAKKPDGTTERVPPDETAFLFLQKKNVHLVVSLSPDERAFYDEQGYLEYWSEQTGYPITAWWVPVDADQTYGLGESSALHAAAELIVTIKRSWPRDGGIYVHGDRDATAVVTAAYEVWRNRGWASADAVWTSVEQRFVRSLAGSADAAVPNARRESLRALRRHMEYVGEL